ncbi:phosphoglycerate dehydrogenase [Ruminococcus sp.]|uniref:phosphoglycerate dehydrogenase n=1 Tax=Ruminococcus sp. TaxID=41978 RepID=UPI0025D5D6F3|nr:phosphoglycerate dehydrogenase [Ruminococcus sp.]MCI5816728.1 phosphoglycerate dehydrogenase [Ruminococcus sp.]MDD7555122.1 phosphoglycerate dehydrogenase [Ruminococcus sp.]MDY4964392.1 phosphoglycerate dehydrogenase [Ruminococcus callidus]
MFQIQTLNKISKVGTCRLDAAKYTVADAPENPDAIMVRSAAMHDMEFGSNLLAIARAGAGVNNIPVDKCAEQGIVVFNTPGANANAVKELVVAGLLLSSRKISEAMAWVPSLKDEGDNVGKLVEKGKSQFAGPEIKGKTLGIIGLGAIGALVANVAIDLGMKVIGTDPFLSVGAALRLSPAVQVAKSADEVLAAADYLTIHVPYNADTKGFINAEAIAKMKDGARVLNFARGELVNDADMIAALESGKIACYVTDFPNANTIGVKNIIAIPHLGASTPESEDNCAMMAADELVAYLEQGNIINSVNFPNAEMHANGTKLCVLHKNVPTIIAQITAALGDAGKNIDNMVNASKKDNAYTMIDVAGDVADSIVDAVKAIEGVIRVRVIA